MDRLTGLEVFAAIVDNGGFARAAQALRMSPAMVSTHLARLEARLGVPLLIRTTRRIELTQRGQQLLRETRHILAALTAAEDAAKGSTTPAGHVRIDAPAAIGMAFIVPALKAFRLAYPQITLDLSLGDRGVIFRPDGFDIVVRVGDPPRTDAHVYKLSETRMVVVAAPAYLSANPAPQTPDDLAGHDCIIYSSVQSRDDHPWRFTADGVTRWVRPHEAIILNDGAAIQGAAAAGLGIAQTLEMLAAPDLASGRLVRLLDRWTQTPLPVYQFSPPDRQERLPVQAVRSFLATAINWQNAG